MSLFSTKKPPRQFEFQRTGPIARPPGGHKPDLTLGIKKTGIVEKTVEPQQVTKTKKVVALDALFLVDVLRSSKFSEFKIVDGSGKKLNSVDSKALEELVNVDTADFSDNNLPLEPFSVMPSLRNLDLSCNNIKSFSYAESASITGENRPWSSLKTLNLGFNSLQNSISELASIRQLTTLNLSHNSISSLPSNMMHFTCLTTIDLSGNQLFSEAAFFSLATIQSLRILILDDNKITRVPKFHFGFDSLQRISLKNNLIELSTDVDSLADLIELRSVALVKNPILLRHGEYAEAKRIFDQGNIELIDSEEQTKHKSSDITKIDFDPLTLPSFDPRHIKALNKSKTKSSVVSRDPTKKELAKEDLEKDLKKEERVEDGLFLTSYGGVEIEPTPLPSESSIEVSEPEVSSIWKEVYVLQPEMRKQLTPKTRNDFLRAFQQLEYIANNPKLRIKKQPTDQNTSTNQATPTEDTSVLPERQEKETTKKNQVKQTLEARTEYTKSQIQTMIQSMEERLSTVQRDLQVADESGQTAIDLALDHKNFTQLQKNYEIIRAQLINTLNSK